MSIFLGKKEVSSFINVSETASEPEVVVKELKLQDVTTDCRESLIRPGEGFDGLSRVFVDNTEMLLNEKNYKIITGTLYGADILYDTTSTRFRMKLLFNSSGLKKVYAKNVTYLDYECVKNCLDTEEVEFPKATSIGYEAFVDSYRITRACFPKVERLDTRCFYNTFNSPYGYPSKLNVGHMIHWDDGAFGSAPYLEEIMIGDYNIYDHYKDNSNHVHCFDKRDTTETFGKFLNNILSPCTGLKSLIMPEIHGMYTLEGTLFETVPTNFNIYVDDSMIDRYKNDEKWSVYSSRIKPLTEHASYNYTFVHNPQRYAYKMINYGNASNATESNALKVVTPRSYKGFATILGGSVFNGCYFDKLTIGAGTFGLDDWALQGTTINTLEFEDFTKIHEVGEEAYSAGRIENVILNCTLAEYFDHFNNDDVGYVYTDDSYTTSQSINILSSPWNAGHVYTYPGFEIVDLYLPDEPFNERHFLGWGSLKDAHFNNIYLNRNIYTIWNYAFWDAKDTNIYIPKEVTTVKEAAFYNLWNSNIYCEAESKPAGWESKWDQYFKDNNVTVHWGHKM